MIGYAMMAVGGIGCLILLAVLFRDIARSLYGAWVEYRRTAEIEREIARMQAQPVDPMAVWEMGIEQAFSADAEKRGLKW